MKQKLHHAPWSEKKSTIPVQPSTLLQLLLITASSTLDDAPGPHPLLVKTGDQDKIPACLLILGSSAPKLHCSPQILRLIITAYWSQGICRDSNPAKPAFLGLCPKLQWSWRVGRMLPPQCLVQIRALHSGSGLVFQLSDLGSINMATSWEHDPVRMTVLGQVRQIWKPTHAPNSWSSRHLLLWWNLSLGLSEVRIPRNRAWNWVFLNINLLRNTLRRKGSSMGKGEELKNMWSLLSQLQPDPMGSFGAEVVPHIFEELETNSYKLLSLFFFAIRYITWYTVESMTVDRIWQNPHYTIRGQYICYQNFPFGSPTEHFHCSLWIKKWSFTQFHRQSRGKNDGSTSTKQSMW